MPVDDKSQLSQDYPAKRDLIRMWSCKSACTEICSVLYAHSSQTCANALQLAAPLNLKRPYADVDPIPARIVGDGIDRLSITKRFIV